jgi:hypothetical protein
MLEKNKKFRVIEEGVMNQGEMGMTKGGGCDKSYSTCGIKISYNLCKGKGSHLTYDECPLYLMPNPCKEEYWFCMLEVNYISH